MVVKKQTRKFSAKCQRGNALFLILIAVALFAALSYAITQSGRGGGTINKEQAIISAAQMTQFAAGIRAVVSRMVVTGTAIDDVSFERDMTQAPCDTTPQNCVFSPAGGDATYTDPPPNTGTTWFFAPVNQGNYIADVGTNTDLTGTEAMGFMQITSEALCKAINNGLGLGNSVVNNTGMLDELSIGSNTNAAYGVRGSVVDAYPGEAFGCTYDSGGLAMYVYFHAMIEQ